MRWYTGNTLYDTLLIVGFILAALVFLSARFGTAQYGGRFGKAGQGIKLSSKMGWIIMEIPALIFFPIFFFMGRNAMEVVPLFFLGVWIFHYMNRAIINPMMIREPAGSKGTFDISVIVLGWVTLILHSYLVARFISEYGTHYTPDWFSDPRFIIGLAIYAFGFTLNVYSDKILRNLRSKNPSPDEPRYKIPYGGFFKWVSCPQYFAEIISFIGMAIMMWTLGMAFVIAITVGNLVPRARNAKRSFREFYKLTPRYMRYR